MKVQEYELEYCEQVVSNRKLQWQLLWRTLVGFFKKLPVTVYKGPAVIWDEADTIRQQLGLLDEDDA